MNTHFLKQKKTYWIAGGILLAFAFLIRVKFVFYEHPPKAYLFSDMEGWANMAKDFLRGKYDSFHFFRPIGFTLWVALMQTLGGWFVFNFFQVLLGTSTLALMWRGSARLWSEPLALFVLLVATFHVPFILLSGFVMAGTLFGFLIASLFYLLVRWNGCERKRHAFAMGILFTIAFYVKGHLAFFFPLWALWRKKFQPIAFALLGIAVIASIHLLFSWKIYDQPRIGGENGGLAFVEGKCPEKTNIDSYGRLFLSPVHWQLGERKEKRWNHSFLDGKAFMREGLTCIQKDPWVLIKSFRYVWFLFGGNELWPPNVTPFKTLSRWYSQFYLWLFLPPLILGIFVSIQNRKKYGFLLAIAFSEPILAWVMFAEMRYRVPFDVVYIPLAIFGWSRIYRYIEQRIKPLNSDDATES